MKKSRWGLFVIAFILLVITVLWHSFRGLKPVILPSQHNIAELLEFLLKVVLGGTSKNQVPMDQGINEETLIVFNYQHLILLLHIGGKFEQHKVVVRVYLGLRFLVCGHIPLPFFYSDQQTRSLPDRHTQGSSTPVNRLKI